MALPYRHQNYDARRCAFQALYASHLSGDDPLDVLDGVDGGDRLGPHELHFAESLLDQLAANYDKLANLIDSATEWQLIYESPVELSILELAAAELMAGTTPTAVVINEAVELTKLYAAPAAAGYVNGMLRTIADNTDKLRSGEVTP